MMGKLKFRFLWRILALFLAGVGLSVAIAACSNTVGDRSTPELGTAAKPPIELTLVSYSVTQAAYEKIIPKFAAEWKAEHNQDVTFKQSYGGSGSQTREVIDGLEADVVALALALDTQKLVEAGLIQPEWEKEAPNNAIVHRSVAALVTRDGNPKNVQGWADLAKPGIQVITANPKTSGGAIWNFLALWGSVTRMGGDEQTALNFATEVYRNASILPKDARESTDLFFKQRKGDVLINYENEVLLAKLNGDNLPFVVPEVNISIDNPVAVVDANVDKHGTREVADAFVQFLFTPEAQREFASVGFRPADPSVGEEFAIQYPQLRQLFTVQDLGGWNTVQRHFFEDGALFDQIQSKL
jgi:sulfate/thiosulfate transport system substrate-binding protein